jgi:protein involved in polysaccharide export with SLBB domain
MDLASPKNGRKLLRFARNSKAMMKSLSPLSRLRIASIALLGFACGAMLHAQSTTISPAPSTCDDPAQANTPACSSIEDQVPQSINGNGQNQQGGAVNQTMQGVPQRKTFERNTPLYVDSAGAQEKSGEGNSGRAFPPDPIVDLQRLAKQSTGEMLPIFGRDMFQSAPSTFAPVDQIPVTADYVIGPGDEVLLRIWGHDALNSRLTVDRSGFIYIPQVGPVHVAGLRFDELEQHLNTEVGTAIKNFQLTANLGQLRSIQVVVVGEARRPGTYTVSALSTVLNALFVSGGPNVQGSMRRIEIRRAGEPTAYFDLYDLVLHGDKSKDLRLQPGDVIFIPAVGPQVALAGSVRHPAIYEVTNDNTVGDVLNLAGGLSATATASRISLERIEDHRIRHAMNVELDPAWKGTRLIDGDVLYVMPVSEGYEKTVTIRGNLANPGRFSWHEGMRLSEIIPDRMSLLTGDYWRERNHLGVPTPLFEPLSQNYPESLSRNDATSANRTGTEASSPAGTNDQSQARLPAGATAGAGMSRQAALAAATNAAQSGNQARGGSAELSRSSLADQQQSIANRDVTASGRRNEIGIPAPEIDWSYAVIERLDPKTLKTSLVPFNLGKLLEDHDESQDLPLQPDDVVSILSQADIRVTQDEQTKYVRLEGEIASSGVYSVQPNETLADLVRRAGGLTSKAYLFGASFTRDSARVQQQQRLDEYVSALALELDRSAAIRTVSSTVQIAPGQEPEAALIDHLRQMRATGRVVLEFVPGSAGVDAIPAIPLEDGDVFRVPSRPVTVSVVGAVYGQNVFLYNRTRNVKDYLTLAGKPNRVADTKRSFVIRADGSILSRDSVKGFWNDAFEDARLNPGDTIVVPEKPIKPSALRDVIDWSQVFSQFALGAAAIQVIK